ncbi:MAG: NADH-quinone oxidoreductase subunit L, partial [Phototrophicales bacterium]
MIDYIWLVPCLPLAGFLLNGLLGHRLNDKQVSAIAVSAIGFSFVVAAIIFMQFLKLPEEERFISQSLYTWIHSGNFNVDVRFLLDPLSMVMILVVTGVG